MVLQQLRLLGDAIQLLEAGREAIDERVRQEFMLQRSDLVARILNSLNAVLLVDGLDELQPRQRHKIEQSISELSHKLSSAKIVVSCRSGDYDGGLSGFFTAEIRELTQEQVHEIAERWLGKRQAQSFLAEVRKGSAVELADRPLFLGQMLVVYRNSGSIPDQPWSLTRQMIRLVLQDWDAQNRTVRRSRYAMFDADAKMDFLSHLAHLLTFRYKSQRFSHRRLLEAYSTLCDQFHLPHGQAEQVAQEIEAHTGLIVRSAYEHFEFSHLSVQEYLAAECLVRQGFEHLAQAFSVSPSTVAVAIALSSDPADFMVTLVKAWEKPRRNTRVQDSNHLSYNLFLSRLVQEKPRFSISNQFGRACLILLAKVTDDSASPGDEFLTHRAVASAVRLALDRYYDVDYSSTYSTSFLVRESLSESIRKTIPRRFDLSADQVSKLPPSNLHRS